MVDQKVRKVFLDNLPRIKGFGANSDREVIDWKESIGCVSKFIYDDIKGDIQIVDYSTKNQQVTLKYNNVIRNMSTSTFSKGELGKILGKTTKDFKINIGTYVKDEKRDFIIIDREYRQRPYKKTGTINDKYYKYRCNKCTYEGWIVESGLLTKKSGCYCCSPYKKQVVLGINTIWDTDRWMCDLGVSEEDAKKYTRGNNNKIEVKCPNCNNAKKISINKISHDKSIRCICGDGFSYPEKFMYSMLKQLDVESEIEYTPEYMENKRSDFYLPAYQLVIEVDGFIGHSGGKPYGRSNKTLEEHVANDRWKDEQHLKHGIKTIRINCFKSELEYIKNSILESELAEILDLSNIDWLKCEEFALSNLVKEVCDCWNILKQKSVNNVSKETRYNKSTVRKYLKKGAKLGLCDYDAKLEIVKRISKLNDFKKKPVEVFQNDKLLGSFDSINELIMNSEKLLGIKVSSSGVSGVCRGINKTHKGFVFKYKNK